MSSTDWAFLLLLAVLWGASFFMIEVILEDLDPLTLVAARLVIAAATLWVLAPVLKVPLPRSLKLWRSFLLLGFVNNAVPFSLLTFGQTQISGGLAAILNATTPLFTAIIATLFLADEKMRRTTALGLALGFTGVVVMVGSDVLAGLLGNVAGQLACLGAGLAYGIGIVFARRFTSAGVPPIQVAIGQTTSAALIMTVLTLALAPVFSEPTMLLAMPLRSGAALLTLGIVSTALAYLIFFRLVGSAGATNTSLVTFLVPATAILLGAIFLGERLSLPEIGGMALILAGLAAIDGRLFGRRAAKV